MNLEKSNPDNYESQRDSVINLDALSFDFCEDAFIRHFYDEKLLELGDKAKWIQENQDNLEKNKEKIAKAVENGLIADDQPETIWQFQIDKAKEGQEKIIAIKNEIESRVDEIKSDVAKKLSEYLPDWTAGKAKIIFTMNKKADFCIDRDIITVDLGRLLFEEEPIEKVKEGITHETFHLWMSEDSEWSDSRQDRVSDQSLRNRIVFRTIDEGLAVLICGGSLKAHHEKQGRDFQKFKSESFESFNHFLSEKDRKALEEIKEEEFKNMGHFYVVGNEVVKAVLQRDGIETFKKMVIEAKKNPAVFLDRYKDIRIENIELPKIA